MYHIYVENREALFDRVLVAFSEKIGTSTYSCIWNTSVRCKCCHCLETLFVDKHYNREVSNNDFFSLEGVKIEIRFCSTCDCISFWGKIQAVLRVKFQGLVGMYGVEFILYTVHVEILTWQSDWNWQDFEFLQYKTQETCRNLAFRFCNISVSTWFQMVFFQ